MATDTNDLEGIAQAISHVQETATAAHRDALLALDDGRKYLYRDASHEYTEIERFIKLEGSVSTVESFAELVVTYARRLERADGAQQTVTFTSVGAKYSPDDVDRRHLFTYARVFSQQWTTLIGVLNKAMSHKELIRVIQSLSPSMKDYSLILQSFRRLIVSKDVKLASEPLLNDTGDSQNGYQVQLSIKGGTTETTLPSAIDLKMQYARGSEATYAVPVEVDLTDKDGVPVITLFAPLLPAIADNAIFEEMKSFAASVESAGLKELLIVVNF